MKTIHLIFNAHIDPIWLWPWQASLDEILATCRSACDRLDAHPDLRFSRGEAWVYEQIERMDPDLFGRIRSHVEAGRWEIVGGWYIQPDCNLPSIFAMERQIGLGKQYFQDRFQTFPRIAYNVDSFGHAATLPALMRAAGQDRYVMMRPNNTEMPLPSPRLFRWRGYWDGPEVTVFRIGGAYMQRELTEEHLRASFSGLPDACAHTMCFVGVGDHGGGPTERQIAWCREHIDAIDGWKLEYSTPSRFFDAVAHQTQDLALVTGELQRHAIGCYSVHRTVKQKLRRAEHLLRQSEIALASEGHSVQVVREKLQRAWEKVAFTHFHDTLGGTCLPSAYAQVDDHLGHAASIADEELQTSFRRLIRHLPDDERQRIVVYNASDTEYEGYIEFEPWMEFTDWLTGIRLIDESGNEVAYQAMTSEAQLFGFVRLLFSVKLAAGQIKTIAILPGDAWPTDQTDARDIRIELPNVRFALLEDATDTWSHGIDGYPEAEAAQAEWSEPVIVDRGPLMHSQIVHGKIGASALQAEWRGYGDSPLLWLDLKVTWLEHQKLLKMILDTPTPISSRIDGIMGGRLARPLDGKEYPLRDWTHVALEDGRQIGVICPDVYGLDATRNRIRLTLLRSSVMAHHLPSDGTAPRRTFSDQGVQHFRFCFSAADHDLTDHLESVSQAMQRVPLVADLTKGMKARGGRF